MGRLPGCRSGLPCSSPFSPASRPPSPRRPRLLSASRPPRSTPTGRSHRRSGRRSLGQLRVRRVRRAVRRRRADGHVHRRRHARLGWHQRGRQHGPARADPGPDRPARAPAGRLRRPADQRRGRASPRTRSNSRRSTAPATGSASSTSPGTEAGPHGRSLMTISAPGIAASASDARGGRLRHATSSTSVRRRRASSPPSSWRRRASGAVGVPQTLAATVTERGEPVAGRSVTFTVDGGSERRPRAHGRQTGRTASRW